MYHKKRWIFFSFLFFFPDEKGPLTLEDSSTTEPILSHEICSYNRYPKVGHFLTLVISTRKILPCILVFYGVVTVVKSYLDMLEGSISLPLLEDRDLTSRNKFSFLYRYSFSNLLRKCYMLYILYYKCCHFPFQSCLF